MLRGGNPDPPKKRKNCRYTSVNSLVLGRYLGFLRHLRLFWPLLQRPFGPCHRKKSRLPIGVGIALFLSDRLTCTVLQPLPQGFDKSQNKVVPKRMPPTSSNDPTTKDCPLFLQTKATNGYQAHTTAHTAPPRLQFSSTLRCSPAPQQTHTRTSLKPSSVSLWAPTSRAPDKAKAT